MVLKELICQQFLLKGVCGGLERTDFSQLILWEGEGTLKVTPFLTVSTLGGCDCLERTDL